MIAALLLVSLAQELATPAKPGARQPQLSVGADGHVALAWGAPGGLQCCFGDTDDPEKFGTVHNLSSKLRLSVGMRRGPRIALLDGDAVVLTAIGGEQGGGKDGDVWAWRCAAKSAEWPPAVRVNSVAGSAREGLHALARGPKGEVTCAWIDLRTGTPQVYSARSRDGGARWTDEALVSGTAQICPCCAPSVAYDADGKVYVMWRGEREGARDMQLALPSGKVTKLGSGTWKLDACPMDGGALAPNGEGRMLAVWRREGQVFTALDGASETSIGAGEQPWLAAGTVVWIEKRGGPLFALAPGAKEPQTLAAAANDPVIACRPDGKGPLYVAWETGARDATEIRLARLPAR
jgi:hypothetical protein